MAGTHGKGLAEVPAVLGCLQLGTILQAAHEYTVNTRHITVYTVIYNQHTAPLWQLSIGCQHSVGCRALVENRLDMVWSMLDSDL